jgi:hypothetical protein
VAARCRAAFVYAAVRGEQGAKRDARRALVANKGSRRTITTNTYNVHLSPPLHKKNVMPKRIEGVRAHARAMRGSCSRMTTAA